MNLGVVVHMSNGPLTWAVSAPDVNTSRVFTSMVLDLPQGSKVNAGAKHFNIRTDMPETKVELGKADMVVRYLRHSRSLMPANTDWVSPSRFAELASQFGGSFSHKITPFD